MTRERELRNAVEDAEALVATIRTGFKRGVACGTASAGVALAGPLVPVHVLSVLMIVLGSLGLLVSFGLTWAFVYNHTRVEYQTPSKDPYGGYRTSYRTEHPRETLRIARRAYLNWIEDQA